MNSESTLVQAIELQNQGEIDKAESLFNQILSLEPSNAAALYSLSVIVINRGEHDKALHLTDIGIQAAPRFAPLRFVRGAALQGLGRNEDALKSYDDALEIKPDYIEVLINSGVLLREMLRHKDALERFNQVLHIDPNYIPALANCAIILTEYKQSDKAIAMFEHLLRLKPDFEYGLGLLCYERLHLCDWKDFAGISDQIVQGVRNGKRACKSLAFMAVSDNAADHQSSARIFARHYCPKTSTSLWNGERYRHKKIKLAYVSPDLREHPVCHLMGGVIEQHDKSRFETIAISLGIDDQSRLRSRMVKAFDHFIDAREMGPAQIACLMREMEVDIAVDLAGYTSDSRAQIFAHKPAPVQANYLGYPGTMGTDYMDYIIADRFVIPEEHQRFYNEKVAYLPDAYLPTDAGVKISDRTPSRAECGLPGKSIVFCSFSHDYKISPPLFDIWMRILQRVPDSVLWLMSRSEASQQNLRREAEIRGIDSARLIFAGRVPLVEDHLARYRQADLFLDTHPYNAHTTAADALMAGLPVLTYMGNAFPSRVAGSLLHSIGLPELITHSLSEYENLAVELAQNQGRLAILKEKLRVNKDTHPLFDTEGFCKNLEAIYIAMWRRAQLGGAVDML